MKAFPLPPGLATTGAATIAPRVWGCASCAAAIRRNTCCQRAICWRFDDRGVRIPDRLDAPAHVPADHCTRCCTHSPARVTDLPVHMPTTNAPGRAA